MYEMEDKVALITGGSQGIGKAIAKVFAEAGATAVITDIDSDKGKETVDEITAAGGKAAFYSGDVTDAGSIDKMVSEIVGEYSRIDVLVNNAAIFNRVKVSMVPFDELDLNEWDRMMEVNLRGTFLCSRAVFPSMKKQGGGKIINLASATFFEGTPLMMHYVTSKAGVIGLTRSLASAMAEYNINVNCIAPGRTLSEDPSDTEAVAHNEASASTRRFKRVEYPEDLVGRHIGPGDLVGEHTVLLAHLVNEIGAHPVDQVVGHHRGDDLPPQTMTGNFSGVLFAQGLWKIFRQVFDKVRIVRQVGRQEVVVEHDLRV